MRHRSLMIADVHMSNRLQFAKPTAHGRTDRLEDQLRLWKLVEERAKGVDNVLVLGDLFDKSNPDPVTLAETVGAVRAVSRVAPVYILGGNHDAIDPATGGRFASEVFERIEVENVGYLKTASPMEYGFVRYWPVEYGTIDRMKKSLKLIRRIIGETGAREHEILLIHASIVGCTHENWKCTDGLSQKEATKGFAHTFAGHFHTTQTFGRTGLYLGSPLHFRFDDAGRKAGFWLMDFDSDGSSKRTFVPSKLPRFHVVNWPRREDEKPVKARRGDYVRLVVEKTHAEFQKLKGELQETIETLEGHEIKASFKHRPVYHHVERAVSKKAKSGGSKESLVEGYVDESCVVTEGLDPDRLKKLGRKIIRAVSGGANG